MSRALLIGRLMGRHLRHRPAQAVLMPSALTRALGASPQQLTAGLLAAQLLPVLPGTVLGVPLGIGLFALANGGGGSRRSDQR